VRHQDHNNIIDLQKIRSLAESKINEDSLNKYLGILSFSQLISETSTLINDLNDNKFDSQIALKSKLVFKQLGERLESQSQDYSKIVGEMKVNISEKIDHLTPKL
jgi:hypothetical protein